MKAFLCTKHRECNDETDQSLPPASTVLWSIFKTPSPRKNRANKWLLMTSTGGDFTPSTSARKRKMKDHMTCLYSHLMKTASTSFKTSLLVWNNIYIIYIDLLIIKVHCWLLQSAMQWTNGDLAGPFEKATDCWFNCWMLKVVCTRHAVGKK